MGESIRADKLKKLEAFKSAGIDPFPAGPFEKESSQQVVSYPLGTAVRVAGRIMLFREMGNITFLHIQDEAGRIQIVLNRAKLVEQDYKFWVRNLDMGDFIGVEGERFDTNKGEQSVLVHRLTLLTKSLLPLPDKHKALQDEEKRLRKRYLDLMLNQDVRKIVYQRERFWNSMREFLQQKGFLEVFTPVLETTTGGADARPFSTHHNALGIDVYLRISVGELWQKRLMVAGFEKTFEIGRQFRNEGIDAEHLNDYTQMEFYWAYANYQQGMALVEELYKHVALATCGTLKFTIGEFEVDLGKPWERFEYVPTIERMTGINVMQADLETVERKLKELGVVYDKKGFNLTRAIDSLWKYCRRQICGPGFLVDEPVSVSPLAKRKPSNPDLTERFHVLIAGSEVGNGYSELNDPIDQAGRFEEQERLRRAGDDEAQMADMDFVEALEYGMPPTCGFGVSERLLWFLLNRNGRDCQTFPLMRPEGI
jgi:lysyl-tRNA synthetase class 2